VNGTCGGMACKPDGQACASNAQCCNGTCTNGVCGPAGVDVGTCCTAGATKGCTNATIQNCVCVTNSDAYCCDTAWDAQCVTEVGTFGCAMCP
jgi:hypothetical protein